MDATIPRLGQVIQVIRDAGADPVVNILPGGRTHTVKADPLLDLFASGVLDPTDVYGTGTRVIDAGRVCSLCALD